MAAVGYCLHSAAAAAAAAAAGDGAPAAIAAAPSHQCCVRKHLLHRGAHGFGRHKLQRARPKPYTPLCSCYTCFPAPSTLVHHRLFLHESSIGVSGEDTVIKGGRLWKAASQKPQSPARHLRNPLALSPQAGVRWVLWPMQTGALAGHEPCIERI